MALRLALSSSPRADPAYSANVKPLMGWCSAIWAKLVPHVLMEKAWTWMVGKHGPEGPPLGAGHWTLRGPAGDLQAVGMANGELARGDRRGRRYH